MGFAMRSDQVERRLKLRELRVLLAVVKAGSMAKGAAELGISQPNVSKAISDLELALGVTLLDRGPRGVEATAYGLTVIKRGVAVFDELRHAIEDVAFLADPTCGELRLGCTDWSAGSVCLAIDRISRQYARIKFDVLSSDIATLQRELKGRTIELFVANSLYSLSKEDFDAEILYDDPLIVVADAQHALVRRRRVELADLINEAWVLPPNDTIGGAYIRNALQRNGLALTNTVVSAYSPVVQHNLIATTRFLTVMPKSMLQNMARNHSLRALPVHLPTTQRRIAAIVLKRRMLSPIAKLFIETLCAVARPPTKGKKSA